MTTPNPASTKSVIARHVQSRIEEALDDTHVMFLVGPRQGGKTTLARRPCGH